MKFYIPVPILNQKSPLIDIPLEEVTTKISQGSLVDKNFFPVKVNGRIDESTQPYISDYLVTPYPIFSQKVASVISQHVLDNIQLIPAFVSVNKVKFDDYFILNSDLFIDVIDEDKSEICRRSTGAILDVEKLVLDKNKIRELTENKTMLFRLIGKPSIFIFSETLVDIIKKVDPEGVQFVEAEKWYSTILFDM